MDWNRVKLAVGLAALLTACPCVQAIPPPRTHVRLIGRAYLDAYWKFYPTEAAGAGLHAYDGQVPDRSPERIRQWVAFNRKMRARIATVDAGKLSPDGLVDLRILDNTAAEELLKFETLRVHRRRPMTYDLSWGLLNFIRRDYAPLDERIKGATRLLKGVPDVLAQGRGSLDAVLPKVFCRVAISNFRGSADFVRSDCVEAFKGVKNDDALREFKSAADKAAAAIDGFVAFLENERLPGADDSFAIGESAFRKLLEDTEGVTISLDALRAIGVRDLERNLSRARSIAARHFDGQSVAAVMNLMKTHVYSAEALIPSIAAELDSIRQFCIDRSIVTIPSDVRAIVAETPKFARWATAMMSTPGAFETVATEAYYDVTPVDPRWSAQEKRQWLADFNRYVAANVSVHEAYPGHYVQYLHSNRAKSKVQKAFVSYSGAEGWAHYAEQMMVEQGFGAGDPFQEIAQIQDALLRNCRFLCAIDLHTRGMTVDQATDFFMKNTFLEELPARREAERGTFDPGYFKYTLGKLQILKLREDYKKKVGDAFSLKKFHDDLLSHGMPVVAVIRERMLGADSGPSL